jgi:hypothetical protein
MGASGAVRSLNNGRGEKQELGNPSFGIVLSLYNAEGTVHKYIVGSCIVGPEMKPETSGRRCFLNF